MKNISPITEDNDIVNKKYVDDSISNINSEIESIKNELGEIENLETEDKSSLVNAINEVKTNASSGGSATFPIGIIMPIATQTIPKKWLLCDGSEVSRETYYTLFEAIGEIYGAGDGTTTFNIPDMRYRVPVGEIKDTATLYSQASATITYLRFIPSSELLNYNVNDSIEYNGETRTITAISTSNSSYYQFTLDSTFGIVIAKGTEVIVKKKFGATGGEKAHTLTVNELPEHSHTYPTGYDQSQGSTKIMITGTMNSSSQTLTSNTTGGGRPHNIMQPYIVMNYVIYAGA